MAKEKLTDKLQQLCLPSLKEAAESKGNLKVSFEFFPAKTEEGENRLWDAIKKLETLSPRFVSVTYGAGGSTKDNTYKTVTKILKETKLKPAAHLTCVGASREEIDEIAKGYKEAGINHIVALRGDPPKGATRYEPHPQGYAYAADLVAGLKKIHEFEISVAAFPEKHPEASSFESDIDNLQRKLDSGADRAITQYFFDVELYLKFLNKVRQKGITAPIVAGIVPISNYAQIVRFSKMCGASVPKWVEKLLAHLDEEPEAHAAVAAMIASEQCRQLVEEGVEEFHFYTLNRSDLTFAVCNTLGMRA